MNILLIGNFGSGWDGSICDEKHISNALEDLGHEVHEWQREDVNKGFVPNGPFDFILVAQWSGYPPNFIRETKRFYRCPVVYWAFDYQFDSNENWHFEMAKEADFFVSKEMDNREFYKSIGANFKWLPQDFAPEFLDAEEHEKEYDVVFTGSYLPHAPFRTEVLKAIDEKYDLHVFSVTPDQWKEQGLKNVHGPIMDHGLPELYGKSKIVVSVDWKQAEGYWSDRNAQAMCCGAFVLFKYVPMSELVFSEGVAYFNTIDECLEKIEFYLNHEESRNIIANLGYLLAQQNLKVSNRVEQLLTIVEEK